MVLMKTLEQLQFDNTYTRLPDIFYSRVKTDPLSNQHLVSFNPAAAELIQLNPKDASAYYNRGIIYENLSKYQSALNDYVKAIELDPNYVSAYNTRGNVYSKLGLNRKALEDFNKAIQLDPNSASYYFNRVSLYSD